MKSDNGYIFTIFLALTILAAVGLVCSGCGDDGGGGGGGPTEAPGVATGPVPADGSANVSITIDPTWQPANEATSYDVYFGTDSPPTTLLLSDISANSFDPGTLAYETTYFWRVNSKNSIGTTPGTVWSFTTAEELPEAVTYASPGNGSESVDTDVTLQWNPSARADGYKVYFGTTSPPALVCSSATATSYSPEGVEYSSFYYWKVVSYNTAGENASSGIVSFSTRRALYVSLDGASTTKGSSWDDAVDTIQRALDLSCSSDIIFVADGTYAGAGNVDLDFAGKSVILKSENGSEVCVIDCGSYARAAIFNDGEGNSAVFDGFKVMDGYDSYEGGGIYCGDSSPVIRNCIFDNCLAASGAAIFLANSASLVLCCTLQNGGDAMFTYGGGVYCDNTSAVIKNCIIRNNNCNYGGGVYMSESDDSMIINCVVKNNTASLGGGCMAMHSDVVAVNCTFCFNNVTLYGGAFYLSSGDLFLNNSIVWGNLAVGDGAVCHMAAPNTLYISYSLSEELTTGYISGSISTSVESCLVQNPSFSDDDLRLSSASPCIDSGNNAYVDALVVTADLGGDPRKTDGDDPEDGTATVDIGAYEYQP